MAWKDTLFDASFRGVKFDVQRTDDTLERDVARYSYPHVDGEDIEDLGGKTDVNLTAVFFGDDYEKRLKNFLGALSQRGPGELIHPVFGSMPNMQFLGGHVPHDAENVDYCTVEMRFAPSVPGNPFFVAQLTVQVADATAQVAGTAQTAGTSMFGTAMGALKTAQAGLRRLNALRDVLSDTLGPIKNLVTGFRTATVDYLNFPAAFTSDLVGLVGGITDFRSFDAGMVMADWSDLTEQMATVVKLPAAASSGQSLSIPGTATTVATTTAQVDPAAPYSPPRPSTVAASASDVQLVTAVVKVVVATVMAGVASDVLANESDQPTLTPDQIEQITDDTRGMLQDAIDETRAVLAIDDSRPVTEPLKDVALSIQQLAVSVIDALPPLISRTVPAPTNLTLLAYRWYGDYTRSAELLRLNPSVRNPNFIERGEVLYGFAQ
ncbi:DNA circularization protein [Paraburkholderia humisilvae]|uniref:DNA circulation N-terminal domain-containing protein n=1 Tax=Paraburkholderia humisilvae TaxID=627669 RepID=A0A6J5EE95_9BURK|nr:DNA circularization N-terminal domain-containing protein [Paraburkholderia humisilvae]CAB3764097.1 hypothetical protein LMG29542_04778 [Paraburkholderia humisilvae]